MQLQYRQIDVQCGKILIKIALKFIFQELNIKSNRQKHQINVPSLILVAALTLLWYVNTYSKTVN